MTRHRTQNWRSWLLRGALPTLLALPAPAFADSNGPQEIIVTARRLNEQISDVPLSIDVVRADSIITGGVDGLQALARQLPGLSFEASWGGANSFPVLRGQHQPSITGDAVGMFVDGVYQANRDAIDVEPLDLERIEVIHGPQSALFGHSSFSGLIHYIPAEATEKLFASAVADLGTDNLYAARAVLSGPLDGTFKVRFAIGYRTADGSYRNQAAPGQHLGNSERTSAALTIAMRDNASPLSARLSVRFGDSRSNQPPFYGIDYRQYNCGGRDPASGAWSYFCGAAPIASAVSLSPGIPDSRTRSGQAALHLALDSGSVELRSDTSYYRADVTAYRDFDGSAEGDTYGVCNIALNCSGTASLIIPVVRLQRVNIVQRHSQSARELSQEFRIRSTGDRRFAWLLGGTVFWTRQGLRTNFAYGAERGALAANERFSALVLANPLRVGVPAAINSALVDNPDVSQIVQNDAVEYRRTIALFATADYRLASEVRLRGEVRANWERLVLDSRLANFSPSFGENLGARNFFDLTPRFSIDYRPSRNWLVYASYARGSRSGGINAIPGLPPQEQTFEPETNWTAEAGLKYAGSGLIRSLHAAVYDIDWRNTQILGFATTGAVGALITRNTRGIHTQGIEIGTLIAPARWLSFDLAYSYTHPRFKPGSEDPGSDAFCGLALGVTTSSFCTIRPSLINPGQLVADISGNIPARAVATSWSAGATVTPPLTMLGGLVLRADISHRGNEFDRQIDGLTFGARTLLNARLTLPLGRWSAELWGTNLTDARYIRFAVGRQPAFYVGQPRPTDLILGDGRRIGVTLRYNR
ncbi:MAG: TonB-dependent receptor [Novosphingobium sp.]